MVDTYRLREAVATDQWSITALLLRHQLNLVDTGWANFTVAVDEQDQLIGCGQIRSHGDVDELASLAVVDEWQGRGVAKQLMEDLIARGRRPLWLMCESPLTSYYTNWGFAEISDPAQLPVYFRNIYWSARVAFGLLFLMRGTYVAFMVLDQDRAPGAVHGR